MADLTDLQAAQSVKIVGSNTSGVETNSVNADSNGNLQTKDFANGTPGSVVPSTSLQVAGSDGTNLRTVKTDTSGNLITKAQLQDNAGTAVILGQTTMSASLPVAIASNQTAIPASQSGTWTVQQGTPPWSVVGNVASGASDSGNPIKAGGVFNTTPPTLTTGQRGDIQISNRGSVQVAGTSAPGVAPLNNPVYVAGIDGGGLKRGILTDTSGNISAVGSVASGATDSGNPVKIGAIYNSTLPTVTNGQRVDLQGDPNGRLLTKDISDGTTGSTAPTTPSLAGGKDTSGNLQPLPIGEDGNLVTIDAQKVQNSQSKVYVAQTPSINVGTSETAFYLLRNPNGSGKVLKVSQVTFSGAGTFRVYASPTITANGTTVNPILRKITTGSQGNVGLSTSSPTASSNGSLMDTFIVSAQAGTYVYEYDAYIILPANTSILVTAQMGANNTATTAKMEWVEL